MKKLFVTVPVLAILLAGCGSDFIAQEVKPTTPPSKTSAVTPTLPSSTVTSVTKTATAKSVQKKTVKAPTASKASQRVRRPAASSTRTVAPSKPATRKTTQPRKTTAPTYSSSYSKIKKKTVATQTTSSAKLRSQKPSTANSDMWDKIAQCESSGNAKIVSPNGLYGGLYQIDRYGTWAAYGGKQYASTPEKATPEQQYRVAQKIQASQGWGAWPVCSRK